MPNSSDLDPAITQAIGKIEDFIGTSTGKAPSPEELASALTRYFVLNEILGFIKMSRQEQED